MRRWMPLVVFGLLLGLTVPVAATHIQEPTNPIIGLDTRVFEYPNVETTVACVSWAEAEAGAPIDTFEQENVRLHLQVRFAGGPPTEHWTTTVNVSNPFFKSPGNLGNSGLWRAKWGHQNIGPHTPDGVRELQVDLWNTSRHFGLWRIEVIVTGDESGTTFTKDCIFEKV